MGMMTADPNAKIGDVLQVPFQRPRDRQELRSSKDYFE
jgi:nitrate/nitrite transport system ATP-binding protein